MFDGPDLRPAIAASLRPWLARHAGKEIAEAAMVDGEAIVRDVLVREVSAWVEAQADRAPALRHIILSAKPRIVSAALAEARRLTAEAVAELRRRREVEPDVIADFESSVA